MIDKKNIQTINQVICNYFVNNNTIDIIQAKNLMPDFIDAGVFKANHKDGLPIRALLRELQLTEQLNAIPFVWADKKKANTNWYFIRSSFNIFSNKKDNSIGIFEMLYNTQVAGISNSLYKTAIEKQKVAYNLYNISSYNNHRENFHSDLFASLLNPEGLHGEGYLLLDVFINYLNTFYDSRIDTLDFKNIVVTREYGRIDILIRDESSRKAIVIENKIYDAEDMPDQIDRYVNFTSNIINYKISAIIYLTLDGLKKGPINDFKLLPLLKNIAAFNNAENDLVNGWLIPCISVCKTLDSSSLLNQYGKLLRHLANKNMDTDTLEKFYQFLSLENALPTAQAIIELTNRMPEYRASKFAKGFKNILPFKKQHRYKPNYWLFENYRDGDDNFKLDVYFDDDGSASIVFWNPLRQTPDGWTAIEQKLKSINLLEEFDSQPSFGYKKTFKLSTELQTMRDIDQAVQSLVLELISRLQNGKYKS